MKIKIALSTLIVVLLAACNSPKVDLTTTDDESYLSVGDSISTDAQKVLLKNVAQAMKAGGVSNAISFCNEQAVPLTDSVSTHYTNNIKRLSDRNRNPDNAIESDLDESAWENIKLLMADSTKAKHLVMREKNTAYYYKAISIGMPTCLKCHGDKSVQIDPLALKLIAQKYPKDKATGYKMGELRGMWKIKMN